MVVHINDQTKGYDPRTAGVGTPIAPVETEAGWPGSQGGAVCHRWRGSRTCDPLDQRRNTSGRRC